MEHLKILAAAIGDFNKPYSMPQGHRFFIRPINYFFSEDIKYLHRNIGLMNKRIFKASKPSTGLASLLCDIDIRQKGLCDIAKLKG